jgi:hypothetical protein
MYMHSHTKQYMQHMHTNCLPNCLANMYENGEPTKWLTSRKLQTFLALNQSCVVWQGCQMVYFQTKNSNLGKFLRALE